MKRLKSLNRTAPSSNRAQRPPKPPGCHGDYHQGGAANKRICCAFFFWKNDKPDGVCVQFLPSQFSPEELTAQFGEASLHEYFEGVESDLGADAVRLTLEQMAQIAAESKRVGLSYKWGVIAALNIAYLAHRGAIPSDEFNGTIISYCRPGDRW